MFKPLRWALVLSLIALLGACSTSSNPNVGETTPYYVASVDIDATTSQASLEKDFGGKVILFNTEAGYALLGFSKAEGELSSLALDYNQNTFVMPEATASASGYSAWASGWSAWASGWSAWAGGWSAWAGGTSTPSLPNENSDLWKAINLSGAYSKAKKYGDGVVVAVIDTGIDLNHEIFKGRLVASTNWKDFVDNDGSPQEVSGSYKGHGTGVASLILQIAPNAKIMPLRALKGDGSGDVSQVISAVDWAVRKGADIINLSLGTMTDVKALQDVIAYAASKNVYIVASAGNDNQNTVTYPGQYATDVKNSEVVLSVGSINSANQRSSFSNYGTRLEFVTLGEGLYGAFPGGKIAKFTGTSFAAPVISGALALGQSNASDTNKMRVHVEMCNGSTQMSLGRCGRIDLSRMMDAIR